MAITTKTWTANGSQTDFDFPFPYIKAADIKATLNGTATSAFTLADKTVTFTSAPTSGTIVIVYRDTDNDTRSATFFAGSAIKAEDLNSNFDQISYVSQETENYALSTLGGTMSGNIDMNDLHKVINLPAPTAANDGVRKAYVDGLITTHQAQVDAAAASEAAAATSATNAATSATNSATSASNSASSATTSTTQATNSANSATAAATSATNAATSATAAASSATTAGNSEGAAATSESNAATSEGNASGSATTATTQATNASTSATSASNSATSAASSAAAAAAAFDNFDDTYLGQKSSDPTVDNDGDALTGGDLYFNTTSNVMKVYTGSAWVSAYVPGDAVNIVSTATGDVAATNVQAAIAELDTDKVPRTAATGSAKLPIGSSSERDSTPSNGMLRYNSQTQNFEGYSNSSWGAISGGAGGGGTDNIFYENGQTVTANHTITANKNAFTAGPVAINSGITVTIPATSNWTII